MSNQNGQDFQVWGSEPGQRSEVRETPPRQVSAVQAIQAVDIRQVLGILGLILLFIGVFAPLVSIPIVGSQNYFQNGRGDGVIILVLAGASLAIVLLRAYKWLWVTGIGSLGVITATFVNFLWSMSKVRGEMHRELEGNPFKSLAELAIQSVQLQWGFAILLIGAILIIVAAVMHEGISRRALGSSTGAASRRSAFLWGAPISFGLIVAAAVAANLSNQRLLARPDASSLSPFALSTPAPAITPRPLPPPSLSWEYSTHVDEMTGGKIKIARVFSRNEVSFDAPYDGPQRATLIIRKHPRHGQDVFITIERGQFLCMPFEGCTVLVRFDEGTATRWSAVEPADHSTTALFLTSDKSFISKLRRAKTVRISARFFQEGEKVFTFNVAGLVW